MNSIPPKYINHFDELYVLNSEKTIDLLNKGIEAGSLPDRVAQLGKTIFFICVAPLIPVALIGAVFVDFGKGVYDLCVKDQKMNRLCYNLVRVFALDPMYVLYKSVIVIVQIASSFFGIFSPEVAVYGWLGAEYMELGMAELYSGLKTDLGITDHSSETYCLDPNSAKWYFSFKEARSLDPKVPTEEELQEIKDCFADLLLKYMSKCPSYFHKKLPVEEWAGCPYSLAGTEPNDDGSRNAIDWYLRNSDIEDLEKLFKAIKPSYTNFLINSGISYEEYQSIISEAEGELDIINRALYHFQAFGSVNLK